MYLLFDCNNFFASCEQVFRPDWRRRPLVVLSGNDGCIIARSAEAKQAGFKMAEPYFQCKDRLAAMDAVVCSSNFTLYADFSDRIMSILAEALPHVEQYSIDEAFAKVDEGAYQDWDALATQLRRRIRRWTGITVSVGIAPTKTLAKMANEHAKAHPESKGIFAIPRAEDAVDLLRRTRVGEVWGVGRKLEPRMKALSIRSAYDLAQTPLAKLQKAFGVQGERLALELRGQDCIAGQQPSPRGQIMVSRSLKTGIDDRSVLRAVLCRFVEKAARSLRNEGMLCEQLHVLLRSAPFEHMSQQEQATQKVFSWCEGGRIPLLTDDTRDLTRYATEIFERVWQEGYACKKVGVLLSDLTPKEHFQPSFAQPKLPESPLMKTLDGLQRAGHKIHFANYSDSQQPWQRAHSSPNYTSDWNDIPNAY